MKEENKEKLAHWYYRSREVCFAGLALTSAIVVYQAVGGYVPGNVIGLAVAAAVTFAFYLAIDGPLSSMLPVFFQERTHNEWKTKKPGDRKYINLVGAMSMALLLVTGTVSFWSAFIIGDGLVSQPDTNEIIAAVASHRETDMERLERLERSMERARNEHPERLRNATERGRNAVERARNAGSTRWARDFDNHMSYAGTLKAQGRLRGAFAEWYNGVLSARQDSARMVDSEKERLFDAENRFLRVATDTAQTAVIAGIVDIGRKNAEYASWKRETWAHVFILLDVLMALGAVFFTFLLARHENQYGQVIYEGRFSIVHVVNAAFQGATQRPLAFWSKRLAFQTGTPGTPGTEQNAEHARTERNGTERNGTAGSGTDGESRGGTKMTREEMKRYAKQLHSAGKSYREIADAIGVTSTSTVFRLINKK